MASTTHSDVLRICVVADGIDFRAETPTGRRLLALDEVEETIRRQQRELERLRAKLERRRRE